MKIKLLLLQLLKPAVSTEITLSAMLFFWTLKRPDDGFLFGRQVYSLMWGIHRKKLRESKDCFVGSVS